jgi:hypothetical protein
MKNKLIYIALLGSLLLVTRTGVAGTEGENYFGLQYADGDYEEDGISETFNPTLRLGFDLDDDTQNLPELGNRDATLELERLFGLYGTGHFNIAKSFSIYGVLGVSNVKGTASVPSISGLESTEDNTSVSYGIGADIGIGSSWALNIEYIRYLDDDDFELDMANVGASFSF